MFVEPNKKNNDKRNSKPKNDFDCERIERT